MVTYECNVAAPWFDLIAAKKKTIEGRLRTGKFAAMVPGDRLVVNENVAEGLRRKKSLRCRVVAVRAYASFQQFLEHEGLRNALPGIKTVAAGVAIYHTFYPPENAREHGVAAIELSVIVPRRTSTKTVR